MNKQGVKHFLGSGQVKNMSTKLIKYLTEKSTSNKKLL